jgi:hypothetical protein
MLKSLIPAIALVSVIAAPAVSFAQSNEPVTRAQVRAELVQLEQAGYRVGEGDKTSYPTAIQAAEAKVAAQNVAASGYGGVVSGSSEVPRPTVSMTDWNAMYNRH